MNADAVIYTRISEDRLGDELGVERQRKECVAFAERHEWPIVETYPDDDRSAYSGKIRQEWERLMADVRSGRVTRIIAWHTDRLTRRPRDLEDLLERSEKGLTYVYTALDGMDTTTVSGRMTLRILAAIARQESEHKAERARTKANQLAHAGRYTGGPRPFGYGRDGMTLIESEARWVAWMYQQKLSGISAPTVIRELEDNDVRTPRGNRWTSTTINRMLVRPRYAGLASYHDEVLPEPAQWPAIVDRGTWETVRTQINDGPDYRIPTRHNARKFYIAGRVHCGREECGVKLVSYKTAQGKHGMKCRKDHPYYGCGRLAVSMQPLLEMADAYMVAKLSNPDLLHDLAAAETTADAESQELIAKIEADERRLIVLKGSLDEGEEDEVPEVVSAIRKVRERLARNRAALSRRSSLAVLDEVDPDTIADEWHDPRHFSVDRKHTLLCLLVSKIVVHPADTSGYVRFDPGRVEILPT